jgi:hypothetical protein
MARFITTIELHNANDTDYNTLHTELKKASFKEVRHAADANNPNSRKEEYNREGNITLQQVTDAVLKAATKTGKKYSFTIIRNKPIYN